MLSCQNTVNTSVFGWFALRPGSKKMKKTVVFAVHVQPIVEKTSQNTAFSMHSLQNSVNSGVFGRFSSLTLQNVVNTSVFSSKGIKMVLNTVFFWRFWSKIFDREQQQQQQQQQQEEHMTPCNLGAGGPGSGVNTVYTCTIAPRHRCSRSVSTCRGIQQKLNARKVIKQENFYTRHLFTPVLPTLFSNASIQHSSPTLLYHTLLPRFSHKNTTTPPQKHKNTTTPPQKHHHTTTETKRHHHKNTTAKTPPQHHKNTTTHTTTKTQKHHHKTTTKKHHSSTTLYDKVLQSQSAPVLLCTTKYYSVLCTPVLLCTTK